MFDNNKVIVSSDKRTFTFKYDPNSTPHQIFANMWKAIDTGKPSIQPKNVIRSNVKERE